jgi:hypothetical protein
MIASLSVAALLGHVLTSSAVSDAAMKTALEEIQSGRRDAATFSLRFLDLSEFHGNGADVTITGLQLAGVEQHGRDKRHWKKTLAPADLQRLVQSLLDLQLWEQRVPEREAVPDETRTTLELKVGDLSSSVWEWHNGVDHLAKLEAVLTAIAPRPKK